MQNPDFVPFPGLSGLPNANAKSPRFSYAIPQIAPLPPVAALNRNFNSQIAARYAVFWHAASQIALASSFSAPKSQRFKSQRLQHANATKSQTLAFYKSLRFSATKQSFPEEMPIYWVSDFWGLFPLSPRKLSVTLSQEGKI